MLSITLEYQLTDNKLAFREGKMFSNLLLKKRELILCLLDRLVADQGISKLNFAEEDQHECRTRHRGGPKINPRFILWKKNRYLASCSFRGKGLI